MALLSDLIVTLARATGIPQATVFAYGRFAREAGFITQKGRGRGAAEMTSRDAANLLIAVGGTDVTREAGHTIEQYRRLRGTVAGLVDEHEQMLLGWLSPLGIVQDGRVTTLAASFGETLEFLIEEAGKGKLHRMLANIPTYELSDELWARWMEEKSPNLHISVDELIRRGLIEPGFDNQVGIVVSFSRTSRTAEISISREWGGIQEVFNIHFDSVTGTEDQLHPAWRSGYRVLANLDDQSLAGLGLALQGQQIPEDQWPVDFYEFFGVAKFAQIEHALHAPSVPERDSHEPEQYLFPSAAQENGRVR